MKKHTLRNSDYTMRQGKEAAISNRRQSMEQRQHDQTDEFVKRSQAKTARMGGRAPKMKEEFYKFDACMTNTGESAQEFGRKLTKGLDKTAFPVK